MDNMTYSEITDRKVDISKLSKESKNDLRKYYYEMPSDIRTGIAFQIREIFPEIPSKMNMIIDRCDTREIIKETSELNKIFDVEYKKVRFLLPETFANTLRGTVFFESWSPQTLLYGLRTITKLYNDQLTLAKQSRDVLQFMLNYLMAWLDQKEKGMIFFCKTFRSADFYRLIKSPCSLCDIIREYLRCDKAPIIRVNLENLFWAMLSVEPSEKANENIFFILDIMRATRISAPVDKNTDTITIEHADVSTISESDIADNIGQVSIFGTHDFGSMGVDQIKSELLRLNRNTISEYLGGKLSDNNISFDIPEQVKMILREELSPNMCAVTIRRGNEVDMATLITHDGKTYLLFRKLGENNITFGISIGSMEHGERELIGVSNESDFTYSLVGGEEIGING